MKGTILGQGGLNNTDKQALIAIANEAEQSDLALRTEYANVINAKGVPASSADSHDNLISKINQIKVLNGEKKTASGTAGIPPSPYNLTISGLAFIPRCIVVKLVDVNVVNIYNVELGWNNRFVNGLTETGIFTNVAMGTFTVNLYGGYSTQWFASE